MMKRFTNYLFIMLMGTLVFLYSCNEDDPVPDSPKVVAPSGITELKPDETIQLTFNVTMPGGYKSAVTTSSPSGTAVIATQPEANSTSGTVVVDFTAPASDGVAIVTVSITDNNDKDAVADATVVFNADVKPIVDITPSLTGVGTTTWTADNTYILRGFIFVNHGQTLTIEPGTVIKGQPGQGVGASALIVARGGKLIAEGTAENPIIFTGLQDNLDGSVPVTTNGLWGGLIILGSSITNNISLDPEEAEGLSAEGKSIEGIPTSEKRGKYGKGKVTEAQIGADVNGDGTIDDAVVDYPETATDNSGSIKYVSVRHGGSTIGADNEINGITLGAVGSGTMIEQVEVFANQDDGIECFGGSVDIKYATLAFCGDDGLDFDEGYTANVQYGVVYHTGQTVLTEDPRGGEWDGGVGENEEAEPYSKVKVSNVTFVYKNDKNDAVIDRALRLRDNSAGSLYNSILIGYGGKVSVEFRNDKANSYDRYVDGDLNLEGLIVYNLKGNTTDIKSQFEIKYEKGAVTDLPNGQADEDAFLADMAAKNTLIDPAFGTGKDLFKPSAAEAKQDIADVPSGLTKEGYKGGVDPDAVSPFFSWTKLYSVL